MDETALVQNFKQQYSAYINFSICSRLLYALMEPKALGLKEKKISNTEINKLAQ
jgi:hypothetical protein